MTKIDQPHAPFAMPALPYDKNALAPHISAETIDYHYGKHLQTYVKNLNNLVAEGEFAAAGLEDIVRRASGAVFNNAAQVWNHSLYFLQFSPTPKRAPTGELAEAIARDFGSLEAMREKFAQSALGLFGSGWTWLVADKSGGKLSIVNTSNAGNPLTDGHLPLMVIDVWEHAYYIDHRNARAASIETFWKILDWKVAEERY
jgi:Fe-Mn family superoxide dismutase